MYVCIFLSNVHVCNVQCNSKLSLSMVKWSYLRTYSFLSTLFLLGRDVACETMGCWYYLECQTGRWDFVPQRAVYRCSYAAKAEHIGHPCGVSLLVIINRFTAYLLSLVPRLPSHARVGGEPGDEATIFCVSFLEFANPVIESQVHRERLMECVCKHKY